MLHGGLDEGAKQPQPTRVTNERNKMSKLKEIRFSYAESMEKLIIPRLVWEQPDIDHEKGGVVYAELPDEIRNYLMEAATKADERREEEVPGGTSVVVENKWPDIAPITTTLDKINLEGETNRKEKK